jgi:hypothetical protein
MPTLTISNPKSTASIAGPISGSPEGQVTQKRKDKEYNWERALLGADLIMAALAAIFGLIDFLGEPRIRALQAGRVGTWSIAIA